MKRLLSVIITTAIVLSTVSFAFADSDNNRGAKVSEQVRTSQYERYTYKLSDQNKFKGEDVSFKIDGSPLIRYERFKLSIRAVEKGLGAKVTYVKPVLTVTKDATTIIINFQAKTVLVNGVADTTSGIFTAKNTKKTTVLVKYLADKLGVRITISKDKIKIDKDDDDDEDFKKLTQITDISLYPSNITGTSFVLNSSTLYFTAIATIPAGSATGGKAELYVNGKLAASDTTIGAADTTVVFTTSDGTPVNAELAALVPKGGVVLVKLLNATGTTVAYGKADKRVVVDYIAPVVTAITSAVYDTDDDKIMLTATGLLEKGDKVDVTKISLMDTSLAKNYTLTAATSTVTTGSVAYVNEDKVLIIKLGATDKAGLAGFLGTDVFLTISAGSLITDAAGNVSAPATAAQTMQVTVQN